MQYWFSCKDIGIDCSFTAHSDDLEKLVMLVKRHGMSAHGLSCSQLSHDKIVRRTKVTPGEMEVLAVLHICR